MEFALPVDASFMLVLDGKEGESCFVALAFCLVSSSSDESPPARASNSASRSAILTLVKVKFVVLSEMCDEACSGTRTSSLVNDWRNVDGEGIRPVRFYIYLEYKLDEWK